MTSCSPPARSPSPACRRPRPQVGEECQAHCLQQFAAGDTSLAACAKSVAVMLQMCRTLVTAAAQSSPRLKDIARVCGQVCRSCAAACEKASA